MNNSNIVITISRQIGSGGKHLGQKLAKKLNLLYMDDEIVREAAKDMGTSVEEIESRDEKESGILNNLLSYSARGSFEYSPEIVIITNEDAHKAESNVIRKVAGEKSAMIIGRAGSYVLRNHPRHASIFLHADLDFRSKRTQALNNISEDEALNLIEKTDKQRQKFYKVFTGKDMYNACSYDLSINTSKLGFEKTEALIIKYLKARFGDELYFR